MCPRRNHDTAHGRAKYDHCGTKDTIRVLNSRSMLTRWTGTRVGDFLHVHICRGIASKNIFKNAETCANNKPKDGNDPSIVFTERLQKQTEEQLLSLTHQKHSKDLATERPATQVNMAFGFENERCRGTQNKLMRDLSRLTTDAYCMKGF